MVRGLVVRVLCEQKERQENIRQAKSYYEAWKHCRGVWIATK